MSENIENKQHLWQAWISPEEFIALQALQTRLTMRGMGFCSHRRMLQLLMEYEKQTEGKSEC